MHSTAGGKYGEVIRRQVSSERCQGPTAGIQWVSSDNSIEPRRYCTQLQPAKDVTSDAGNFFHRGPSRIILDRVGMCRTTWRCFSASKTALRPSVYHVSYNISISSTRLWNHIARRTSLLQRVPADWHTQHPFERQTHVA